MIEGLPKHWSDEECQGLLNTFGELATYDFMDGDQHLVSYRSRTAAHRASVRQKRDVSGTCGRAVAR